MLKRVLSEHKLYNLATQMKGNYRRWLDRDMIRM